MFSRLRNFACNRLSGCSGLRFFIRNWLVPGDTLRAAQVFSTMRVSRVLAPKVLPGPGATRIAPGPGKTLGASRIAAIAPHPDDEVIGPGGTLLRAISGGAAVTCIFVTDGDAPAEQADGRRAEAASAAQGLGIQAVFLGEAPGAIPCHEDAAKRLAAAALGANPEVLFVPFLLDDNDDHRRVNELLLAAVRKALLPRDLPVWAYSVYAPLPGNVVVDITDMAERKASAIRLYASQMEKRDWAHFALGVGAVNSRLLPGSPKARYAESFFAMPLGDYAELCVLYFEPDATPCYLWEPYRRA